MDREEWTDSQLPKQIGTVEWDVDVCPGWVGRLEQVSEIAQAWKAFDKGCWESFFPDAFNSVCEGVMVLDDAIKSYSSWLTQQAKQKQGH